MSPTEQALRDTLVRNVNSARMPRGVNERDGAL